MRRPAPLSYRFLERFTVGVDPQVINVIGATSVDKDLATKVRGQDADAEREMAKFLAKTIPPLAEIATLMLFLGERPVADCAYSVGRIGQGPLEGSNLGQELLDSEDFLRSQRARQSSILISKAPDFCVVILPKQRQAGMVLCSTRHPGFGLHWCSGTEDVRGVHFIGTFARVTSTSAANTRCWVWGNSSPNAVSALLSEAATSGLMPRFISAAGAAVFAGTSCK